MSTIQPGTPESDLDADPARSVVVAQQRKVCNNAKAQSAPIYFAWGIAWAAGYAVMAAGTRADYTAGAQTYFIFWMLLLVAALFSVFYIWQNSRASLGRSAHVRKLSRLAWVLGALVTIAINSRIVAVSNSVATPATNELVALTSSALPCLVVGIMLICSAAFWSEPPMAIVGVWILVVTAAATIVGLPAGWWIMSLGGGLGMVVAGIKDLRA